MTLLLHKKSFLEYISLDKDMQLIACSLKKKKNQQSALGVFLKKGSLMSSFAPKGQVCLFICLNKAVALRKQQTN